MVNQMQPNVSLLGIFYGSFRPITSSQSFCFGDFNEITNMKEKRGAWFRLSGQMEKFQEATDSCGLCEIPSFSLKFTWSTKDEELILQKRSWIG